MRNRHGHEKRGLLIPPHLPASTNPKQKFVATALKAIEHAEKHNPKISSLQFAFEDIPPSDPAQWEGNEPVLSRCFRASLISGQTHRVVLYRIPLLHATESKKELETLIMSIALGQCARIHHNKSTTECDCPQVTAHP